MKIVDYIILTSDRLKSSEREVGVGTTAHAKVIDHGIEDEVKRKISEGYQPYGFINIQGEYQYTMYTQVMVKYEDVV